MPERPQGSIVRPAIVEQILADFDYPEDSRETGLRDEALARWKGMLQTQYATNGALCGWLLSCSEHMRGGGLVRGANQLFELAQTIARNINMEAAAAARAAMVEHPDARTLSDKPKVSGVGLRTKR